MEHNGPIGAPWGRFLMTGDAQGGGGKGLARLEGPGPRRRRCYTLWSVTVLAPSLASAQRWAHKAVKGLSA